MHIRPFSRNFDKYRHCHFSKTRDVDSRSFISRLDIARLVVSHSAFDMRLARNSSTTLFPTDAMPEFLNHWLYEFVTLLVILDPIATVPMFLTAAVGLSPVQSARLAICALGIAFGILVFFIGFGQHLLEVLKIPMASFQLAGSIIFLVLGLQMATGQLGSHAPQNTAGQTLMSRAIFPLATPGIAGGGAILTVVLLTDNHTRSVQEQLRTSGVLLACLSVHLLSFLLAGYIFRWIGNAGIQIISRVFGLILTSLAVNGMIVAIKQSFALGG